LKAISGAQENLHARGDAIQQKETCWLEMAVTLNCSLHDNKSSAGNAIPSAGNAVLRKNCQATCQHLFFCALVSDP
jgi:hypothetical protein